MLERFAKSVAAGCQRFPHAVAGAISTLAFCLRAGAAFWGPPHFWAYTRYYDMASNLVRGVGYCLGSDGSLCAYFPPVYPTLVAAGILTGHPEAAIKLMGALLGAGACWLTYRIGTLLFGALVGLTAALYAAVYPYYVWHDGVLQENAALTFTVAAAVYLLLRANREGSRMLWLTAGMALGMTVLTKANLLL